MKDETLLVKVIKSENFDGEYMTHWLENDLKGQVIKVKMEYSGFYGRNIYRIIGFEKYANSILFIHNTVTISDIIKNI